MCVCVSFYTTSALQIGSNAEFVRRKRMRARTHVHEQRKTFICTQESDPCTEQQGNIMSHSIPRASSPRARLLEHDFVSLWNANTPWPRTGDPHCDASFLLGCLEQVCREPDKFDPSLV